MTSFSQQNPFARRETHSKPSMNVYKLLSVFSWLAIVISSVCYTFNPPHDDKSRHTIWEQNDLHPTPFAMNSIITSIYWLVVFIGQINYVLALFSHKEEERNAAAGVGSHFILSNFLLFAWVMLFVRSHFVLAELVLIVNFFNLSSLYFRHSILSKFIHFPVVSGPLAWTFVALYWNGAIAVNAHHLIARILANVAIWGILVYGGFFLIAYKDYTIGFSLSVLTAAIGTTQFLVKTIAFQWIFAFTIMSVLFLATLVIGVPGIFGKEIAWRKDTLIVDQDQEEAPLLEGN